MTPIDRKMQMVLLYFILFFLDVVVTRGNDGITDNHHQSRMRRKKERQKLLIIVIDGFRWDYLHEANQQGVNRKQKNRVEVSKYPGFEKFMKQGVHTEYIKSVFPSESFPSWQTINTGRYPGTHGIIANQFFDQSQGIDHSRKFFDHMDPHSTGHMQWWSDSEKSFEPIWVTARKQHVKFSAFLWARCDVDWSDVKTLRLGSDCENVYSKDHSKTLRHNMEMALIKLQTGSDAVIVYEDSLGKMAETFGPDSPQRNQALTGIDEDLVHLDKRLNVSNMNSFVNVIITSDHGITRRPGGDKQIEIGKKLRELRLVRDVAMIVGSGAYTMIHPKDDPTESVLDAPTKNNDRHMRIVRGLKQVLRGQADVYRKNEIPEHLHWKENKNAPPILVVAKEGYVINPATGRERELQNPVAPNSMGRIRRVGQRGISGYDPEYPDMRGVFMAHGPGFNIKPEAQGPIEIVDLYQMFCHLLDIIPAENDGVWDRIKGLLRNSSVRQNSSNVVLLLTFCALIWTTLN